MARGMLVWWDVGLPSVLSRALDTGHRASARYTGSPLLFLSAAVVVDFLPRSSLVQAAATFNSTLDASHQRAAARPASLHVISLRKVKRNKYLVGLSCARVYRRLPSLTSIRDLLHFTLVDSRSPQTTHFILDTATTMSLFMRVIHLGQAFLSGYAAYHSYNAITNLQAYEATSEKLAEWSNEAAKQLAQTRATQTSGALAVRATSQTYYPQIKVQDQTNVYLPDPTLLSDISRPHFLPRSLAFCCALRGFASPRHHRPAGAQSHEELLGAEGWQDGGCESAAA